MHELEEARDDLVRMVSHDLRTPLNVVYTQAHLLERHAEPPEKVAERARSIVRSCERMNGMIQDLVEATLLEAGQLPLARAPIDLAAFMPELLERLRGALPVERVRLEVEVGAFQAELDAARVERIVVNLVSNALKYSSQEVVVRLDQGPLGTVVLAVADRGVGISPEDLPRIFDRFFRARGTRRPEGLGLGLYIARLLAEAHGGRVEVESELGQGSVFRLILPAAAPAQPAAEP
jgi:signal transduction histidine kinase